MGDSTETENTLLGHSDKRRSWTTRDCLVLTLNILVKLGDSVEIYLPGVITQDVSCQMGLSSLQEGFLAVILYVTMGATILVTAFLTDRFGRRPILLFSLYVSILVTVFCAVVPNYYTLLLSRALLGFCIGLNSSTVNVFFSEQVSSREVYRRGTLASDIAFAIGGGWVAILGFFLLESSGWRIFVVCTSLPFFIPPIIILHLYLTEDVPMGGDEEQINEVVIKVPGQTTRVAKASAMKLINTLQGYGTIMLLPSLIRADNKLTGSTDNCDYVVHGIQLLLLAVVSGGTNIIGRSAGYLLQRKARFRILQPVLATSMATCYMVLIFKSDLITSVVALATAKLIYAMMVIEINLLTFDRAFLGSENFAVNSGKVFSSGMVGAIIGNTLAAFFKPEVAVITAGVLSWVQVAVVSSVTELDLLV